jgi:hypothetical protein
MPTMFSTRAVRCPLFGGCRADLRSECSDCRADQCVDREELGARARPFQAAGHRGPVRPACSCPRETGTAAWRGRRRRSSPTAPPSAEPLPAGQRQQLASAMPTARGCRNRPVTPFRKGATVSGRPPDDLHAGGQDGGLRVAGDGTDLDTLGDQQVDKGARDGAGRAPVTRIMTGLSLYGYRYAS